MIDVVGEDELAERTKHSRELHDTVRSAELTNRGQLDYTAAVIGYRKRSADP